MEERYLLPVENKASVRMETDAVSGVTRSKCVSEEMHPRQK